MSQKTTFCFQHLLYEFAFTYLEFIWFQCAWKSFYPSSSFWKHMCPRSARHWQLRLFPSPAFYPFVTFLPLNAEKSFVSLNKPKCFFISLIQLTCLGLFGYDRQIVLAHVIWAIITTSNKAPTRKWNPLASATTFTTLWNTEKSYQVRSTDWWFVLFIFIWKSCPTTKVFLLTCI